MTSVVLFLKMLLRKTLGSSEEKDLTTGFAGSGVDVHSIIDQIEGIGVEHAVFQKGGRVLFIPDAIPRIIEKRYGLNGNLVQTATLTGDLCPECGSGITHKEGCRTVMLVDTQNVDKTANTFYIP